jgi:hypothetical protein
VLCWCGRCCVVGAGAVGVVCCVGTVGVGAVGAVW